VSYHTVVKMLLFVLFFAITLTLAIALFLLAYVLCYFYLIHWLNYSFFILSTSVDHSKYCSLDDRHPKVVLSGWHYRCPFHTVGATILSLVKMKLSTSNLVYRLTILSTSWCMLDYPLKCTCLRQVIPFHFYKLNEWCCLGNGMGFFKCKYEG